MCLSSESTLVLRKLSLVCNGKELSQTFFARVSDKELSTPKQMVLGPRVVFLSCAFLQGHVFCFVCIHRWVKKQQSNCPACRAEVRQIKKTLSMPEIEEKNVSYGLFFSCVRCHCSCTVAVVVVVNLSSSSVLYSFFGSATSTSQSAWQCTKKTT